MKHFHEMFVFSESVCYIVHCQQIAGHAHKRAVFYIAFYIEIETALFVLPKDAQRNISKGTSWRQTISHSKNYP